MLERASKLETFSENITRCDIALEVPHQHSRSKRHYRVRIDVTVPGAEVVVDNTPDENVESQDVFAAIDRAFDNAGRRLEDHMRRRRGDVKQHIDPYRDGRVSKLWTHEDYGFISDAEGSEIYFHRNSVLHRAFDRLAIGAKVRFIEEMGDKGPQASTVVVVD